MRKSANQTFEKTTAWNTKEYNSMRYETVLATLNSKRNGSFFRCVWERPLKTKEQRQAD